MNGKALAAQVLSKMGGKVTAQRRKAFEALCDAIIEHIQSQGIVIGTVTTGAGAGGVVQGKVQ